MRHPVFTSTARQQAYDAKGYETLPVLSDAVQASVLELYHELKLEGAGDTGIKVSMLHPDVERRRAVRDQLVETIMPELDPYLSDRVAFMGTFLGKGEKAHAIWAHQDWTNCDEARHDSIMCWIPLCDVNRENSALGLIEGSHKWFSHLRAFPYDVAETPVYQNRWRIPPYMKILPMQAGEPVIFNNRTIHGSFPNYSGRERPAVILSLRPKNEALYCYYLKPDGAGRTLLKYTVDHDFYLKYNTAAMLMHYQQGKIIEDYPYEEVPYEVSPMPWLELRRRLEETGHVLDPWLLEKAEEALGRKLFEVDGAAGL